MDTVKETFKGREARSLFIYSILAWEPSVAQITHSYSRRLPALGCKLRLLLFFPIYNSTQLESQNLTKNMPVGLQVPKSI